MSLKPFLKWAGGKRWLAEHPSFLLPTYSGRYFEPFLGGGAVFFALSPRRSVLSDSNTRLIETYQAIRDDWRALVRILGVHHSRHSADYYYRQRARTHETRLARAAQFIYLNRACWNGLYRVNRNGEFNVPIGTKDWILSEADDFAVVAAALAQADLVACDFEQTIDQAGPGDLVFVDPPYTVAHNLNGFVKYNEKIFSWDDQVRLASCLERAAARGASIVATNADHDSIRLLYADKFEITRISRNSIISGSAKGRRSTSELLITGGSA